jgi:hypothetical protein
VGRIEPLDLSKAHTVSLSGRDSAYAVENFVQVDPIPDLLPLAAAWPKILKGQELLDLIDLWVAAVRAQKTRLLMFGAHVIKCGLGPLLNQLVEHNAVSILATHGAGALHDVEIALNGATSEDVDRNLADGSFGMARDTAALYFRAVHRAQAETIGLGEALKQTLHEADPPFSAQSFLCYAARHDVPVTVHAVVGTDTLAQHPEYPAAEIGASAYRDFLLLGGALRQLHEGGLVLNCGSAVVLPEVFLKALSAARNVHGPVNNFTTANFDMIQHYRPDQNVVRRPTQSGGRGFRFTGHHELLLPLVAWTLLGTLKRGAA